MKWYENIIKKIEFNGNNLFIFDLDNLFNDKNLYRDLSSKYDIFLYENDADYYKYKSFNSAKYKLIYSNKFIQRDFTKDALNISIKDVFKKLDEDIIKNMDVSYYQKLYNYYVEYEKNDFVLSRDDTQKIIIQSIWDIDLAMLYDPTINLRIGLEYLIDNKKIDSFIIERISDNLDINFLELHGNNIKIKKFVESLIIEHINEEIWHKYDLSDDLMQYYLSKVELKSAVISNLIDENLLKQYPWLIKYQLKSNTKEHTINKIKSNLKDLNMYYEKICDDNLINLNDIEDIFSLSKKYLKIIFEIQKNELKFSDFKYDEMYNKTNKIFKSIVIEHVYEQLFDYPYNKRPHTVDRILDFINYNFKDEKIALIVMDGMSYDEWFLLKKYLKSFNITELESFSILPSVTAFSRTAIFTGKTPNRFLDERNHVPSNAEKNGFVDYFIEKGLSENDLLWGYIDLNKDIVKNYKEELKFKYLKGYQKIGMVCNLFDDESHSINVFGEYKSNLYKNITSAIESSNLITLLENLKNNGYKIILTADHGNIYSESNGIKSNKMFEYDHKSTRCLIFDSEVLANQIVSKNPDECTMFNYNLLSNNLFLVMANKGNFSNKTVITHGSFSPEECIVPVVILE